MTEPEVIIVCKNHPTTETYLRCARCSDPICARCAIKAPTGYLCSDCTKKQQKMFDNAEPRDFVTGALSAAILFYIASIGFSFVSRFGFFGWILVFAGSPTVGSLAADLIRGTIRRHRSRALFLTIAISAVIGALPTLIGLLFHFDLFAMIFQGLFLFLAIPAMFVRLSGIQLFR